MWTARAPANIALIKYMGKSQDASNYPTNASLSYTLSHLVTEVTIEDSSIGEDRWKPLEKDGFQVKLTDKGQARFIEFFDDLKEAFGIKGSYVIRSANNFPSDCGLASSASSFAALTKAAYLLARDKATYAEVSPEKLSQISRHGSGSSCRSFFEPWAIWRDKGAEPADISMLDLLHQVVIIEDSVKKVSSSSAHKRVRESMLFEGRGQRAESRLKRLLDSFHVEDWRTAYELCWQEFWDMHVLFETSEPSFGYMTSDSLDVLMTIRKLWEVHEDGPIVTMDAGPNVHLLFRHDQTRMAKAIRAQLEKSSRKVIGNDVATI